jgi:hypothetical protein
MSKLTQVEKSTFLRLFNRGGYVLDFSTSEFDIFTTESIGKPLCTTYGRSKGGSLDAYIWEAHERDVIKLFKDLLDYYEVHYENEIERKDDYAKLYNRCKNIIERIFSNSNPLGITATVLKSKFSSEYLSTQIDMMLKMQSENPTEAIGKAKELVESCCKSILDERSIDWDRKWDIGQLVGETLKSLKLMPYDIPETATAANEIKSILGNLRAIASNLAALRNPYGSGHGKSATYKGLDERHAKLAVGSSITLVSFLWDTHEVRDIGERI